MKSKRRTVYHKEEKNTGTQWKGDTTRKVGENNLRR